MSIDQKLLSQNFLAIVIFLQVTMYISLFLNFPFVRETVGIIYLTFIPGFIFIKLLKLQLGTLESILYSVGFSVAFLMLSGLLINELDSLVGFSFPLSTLPLSLFINTLVLAGTAIVYFRQRKEKQDVNPQNQIISPSFLVLALIPLLSFVGSWFVNATGNSLFLLIAIALIALLFTVVAFNSKLTTIYPFAILIIAITLLFQTTLTSNFIQPYGSDSANELYVATTTQILSHWNPVFPIASNIVYGRYNSMLSITILPTVYSNMTGLSLTWVFKIIYPAIFALVPLGLYLLWKPYIGTKFAFFSAFLFMADITFFTELTGLNREMIAELFFVLLLLVLLNKKIKGEVKFTSFAIFSLGLILSHYAMAEIFLFLIFAGWLASVYLKRPSINLKASMILFLFVVMFAWYIFTSGAVVFNSFTLNAAQVAAQFGGIFTPASRGTEVLSGLGLAQSPSMLNTVSRAFAYLTEIFIAIGIVALILKKTHFRFDRDYAAFSAFAAALLVALIVVPGLADTLNMTRFYHILLMFLAPFCVIGMWTSVKFVFKHEKTILFSLLVVAILVPYFLFQTNFVYEATKTESWSIPLSGYRMDPLQLYGNYGYVDSNSMYSSEWISNNVPYQNNLVADYGLYNALVAYGSIYPGYFGDLSNTTVLHSGEFVGLSPLSVNYEKLTWNDTILPILNQTDLIYSNGGSQVYYLPSGQ
ncbi:MAG: DUF2206 domain-containing protein [Candidatus Bathyarchaeia archaeon]|jgi:uncharacterized membrane protein